MSDSRNVITSLDDEVHQIKDVTETLASILPADHILFVKLSDADKQALIDLFELKTNSRVQYDELNRRIDNIVVGKITDEDIDNLKDVFLTQEEVDETYVKKISLSQVINNVQGTNEELGLVKISLASVINKTDNLTERVDTLEEKVDEINVTLKSSNW